MALSLDIEDHGKERQFHRAIYPALLYPIIKQTLEMPFTCAGNRRGRISVPLPLLERDPKAHDFGIAVYSGRFLKAYFNGLHTLKSPLIIWASKMLIV